MHAHTTPNPHTPPHTGFLKPTSRMRITSIKFSISGSLRVLTIRFSDDPEIPGHGEKKETPQIIKSVPTDIQGKVSHSSLSVASFSSGFKRLQQWDSLSKRPLGALSQAKALHFRKKRILILNLIIPHDSPRETPLLHHYVLQSLQMPGSGSISPYLFIFPSPSSFIFLI